MCLIIFHYQLKIFLRFANANLWSSTPGIAADQSISDRNFSNRYISNNCHDNHVNHQVSF